MELWIAVRKCRCIAFSNSSAWRLIFFFKQSNFRGGYFDIFAGRDGLVRSGSRYYSCEDLHGTFTVTSCYRRRLCHGLVLKGPECPEMLISDISPRMMPDETFYVIIMSVLASEGCEITIISMTLVSLGLEELWRRIRGKRWVILMRIVQKKKRSWQFIC